MAASSPMDAPSSEHGRSERRDTALRVVSSSFESTLANGKPSSSSDIRERPLFRALSL
jgi:hypothetical protein